MRRLCTKSQQWLHDLGQQVNVDINILGWSPTFCAKPDTYNLDENIWGRVISGGDLDDPGNIIPTSIWTMTGNPADPFLQTSIVALGFENGIPVSLNRESLPLEEIILRLNSIGGRYGVGRFNNLRDTPTGFKNHEVVEAPGARIILEAHTALERATLTQSELRTKSLADLEWTTLITNGLWYSPLRESINSFIASISRLVNGEVVLEISPGNVFVSAVRSSYILHPLVVEPALISEFADFSNQEYSEIMALQLRLRANCWQPTKTTLSLRVEDLP